MKEETLRRILSGFLYEVLDDQIIRIHAPTTNILYEADFFRRQVYEENKYGNWLTEKQVEFILFKKLQLLPPNYKDEIKSYRKKIEDTKVELYKCKFSTKQEGLLRRTLRSYESTIQSYYQTLSEYNSNTLDGFCDLCKSDYIVSKVVTDNAGRAFIDEDFDFQTLSRVVATINENAIDNATFREIARSDPWRTYWACNKTNVLNKSVCDWTEEQRNLVMFSRMYDNVYESHECPPDNIIEDDDRLDGWFIYQRRKLEQDKKKRETDQKYKKGDEVYIITDGEEEFRRVEEMNSGAAARIKQQRIDMIKKKGVVKECELPDRKQQIMEQANQKWKQHVKGNR